MYLEILKLISVSMVDGRLLVWTPLSQNINWIIYFMHAIAAFPVECSCPHKVECSISPWSPFSAMNLICLITFSLPLFFLY